MAARVLYERRPSAAHICTTGPRQLQIRLCGEAKLGWCLPGEAGEAAGQIRLVVEPYGGGDRDQGEVGVVLYFCCPFDPDLEYLLFGRLSEVLVFSTV